MIHELLTLWDEFVRWADEKIPDKSECGWHYQSRRTFENFMEYLRRRGE